MQPYNGGDWELLAFVHDLDLIDKHRQLNLTAANTEEVTIRIHHAKPLQIIALEPPGPVEDGQELLRYRADPLRPNQQVEHEHTATLGVAATEGSYARWWVADRLRAAETLIRTKVIPPLLPYL